MDLSQIPWDKMLEAALDTFYMMIFSGIIIFIVGLALGLILYLTGEGGLHENLRLNRGISSMINILRSIPYVILIVIMVPITKLLTGRIIGINAAIPTLVFTMSPFFARIMYMALREVNTGVIEAAKAMGANTWQIITKFLFPEAKPAIISGLTITSVTLLSNTAVAGIAIAAGGLGGIAQQAYQSYDRLIMWTATIMLTIIVFLIQIPGDYIARKIDKR